MSSHRPEATAFLDRLVQALPGESLDNVLQPLIDEEAELRRLWASEKTHGKLQDPYVGLVDVFAAPEAARQTRARAINAEDDNARDGQYIMPIIDEKRRKTGELSMSKNMDEFLTNFRIFTEGSLSQLDWSNVIVAGGCVLACLLPLPDKAKASKRALRKWYHMTAYRTSDVDLFLWGLTPEQAEAKIKSIYEAVRDTIPWDVTCVRTKHAISIHSQYPYRSVQIVLRLYSSPAEILAGFDVDAPCCAYDGKTVWMNPRAIIALMRQCNTVDMSRRSPSYELRLVKYANRGFEVYVPNLQRSNIDPTIYERSIVRIQGLARLLVLEKLSDPETRVQYLDHRRAVRGRPEINRPWQRRSRQLKGDLKDNVALDGLAMNDYDVVSLHIPYGPGWDSKRIDKLIYQTDLGMNSPFNPKNKDRRLHRHPAFFGTMEECIEDCCEYCPEAKDEEERELQKIEDEKYLRGRIRFMQENPGRQSITGSFNPIDVGEWSEQAYIGQTEKFFAAIASNNRIAVAALLNEGAEPNRRDHIGRAPLHVAILSRATQVAEDLIASGARMTARLVDGRTALHLAAQMALPDLISVMFQRSAINKEEAEKEEARKKEKEGGSNSEAMDVDADEDKDEDEEDADEDEDSIRPSSEDDWSSDEGDNKKAPARDGPPATPEPATSGEVPEDSTEEPDVLEVNLPDWDLGFTPLDYAVAAESLNSIAILLNHEANALTVTKGSGTNAQPIHALTVTGLLENKESAARIANRLIVGGAASTTADEHSLTIFHRLVRIPGNAQLIATLLQNDPKAKIAMNAPYIEQYSNSAMVYPLVSAIASRDWATCAVLLAYGAKRIITEDDASKDQHEHDERQRGKESNRWRNNTAYPGNVYMPIETAFAVQEPIAFLLMAMGVDVDLQIFASHRYSYQAHNWKTMIDYARDAVPLIEKTLKDLDTVEADEEYDEKASPPIVEQVETWAEYSKRHYAAIKSLGRYRSTVDAAAQAKKTLEHNEQLRYWKEVVVALEARKAKTWAELKETEQPDKTHQAASRPSNSKEAEKPGYMRQTPDKYPRKEAVANHFKPLYDALYQACWVGDNDKIKQLCQPSEDKTKPVLEVAVEAVHDTSNQYNSGLTTIHIALLRKHWETARLLLAIVASQHKPQEKKLGRFDTRDSDDEDEDSNSDSDMDSEGTAAPLEDRFTDIAQATTSVESAIDMAQFMSLGLLQWVNKEGRYTNGSVIDKAIFDEDVAMLAQLAELYAVIDKSGSLPVYSKHLHTVLSGDNVALLDACIRHSGIGAPRTSKQKPSEEQAIEGSSQPAQLAKENPGKRTYWGLNVHGIKRKDLASKNDPDSVPSQQQAPEMPLVWHAARSQAYKILEYLNTSRPLEAYKFYAECYHDTRAKNLRVESTLSAYSKWIGWEADELGETPLLAATIKVWSGNVKGILPLLRKLFELQPKRMDKYIQLPVTCSHNMTPIMFAIYYGLEEEILDFLLEKGAILDESDEDGWNVFHFAAHGNESRMQDSFRWLLSKLPKDTIAELLIQRTTGTQATPLHVAVNRGMYQAVQLLTETGIQSQALVARRWDGNTPIHSAVKDGRVKMTEVLLTAAARANMDINIENGTGDTPLDIARQQFWQPKTRDSSSLGGEQQPPTLSDGYRSGPPNVKSLNIEETTKRLTELRTIATQLGHTGLLVENNLSEHLLLFTNRVEEDLRRQQQLMLDVEKLVSKKGDEIEADTCSHEKTLAIVEAAYDARVPPRKLVHLADVQEAVQTELDRRFQEMQNNKDKAARQAENEGGLFEDHQNAENEETGDFSGFVEFRVSKVSGNMVDEVGWDRNRYRRERRLLRRY